MTSLPDCRDCQHSVYAKGSYQCIALNTPKPTSWMRGPKQDCGLEARLFENRSEKRYSEYDK